MGNRQGWSLWKIPPPGRCGVRWRKFLERLKRFAWEWVPECCVRQWAHKVAMHDVMRRRYLTVLWPFNYAVQWAWRFNIAWQVAMGETPWIEKEIERRIDRERTEHHEFTQDLLKVVRELDVNLRKSRRGEWNYPHHLAQKVSYLLTMPAGYRIQSRLKGKRGDS